MSDLTKEKVDNSSDECSSQSNEEDEESDVPTVASSYQPPTDDEDSHVSPQAATYESPPADDEDVEAATEDVTYEASPTDEVELPNSPGTRYQLPPGYLDNAREYVHTENDTLTSSPKDDVDSVVDLRNRKRKRDDVDEEDSDAGTSETPNKVLIAEITNAENHTSVVAKHYNTLEEKGVYARKQSKIFYMRNFNNWIKSMLINKYIGKIRDSNSFGAPIRVLDMCCGKGGDLLKWQKGNVTHVICTDIAQVSVEQCENRYKNMPKPNDGKKLFTAEFFDCDATITRLREKYRDPSIELNLVSCQFAFHYCFESLPQAECMLRNAAECLKEGGYFIGTMPDANDIMKRQRSANADSFGNGIYNIEFLCDTDNVPLFGAKYNFKLEEVVDCPEFLVHFPTLVKLAEKFGLQLECKERFEDFFNIMYSSGKPLLERMNALETYTQHSKHAGDSENQYEHVEKHLREKKDQTKNHFKIGTLSKAEWEAGSLYMIFAFRKMKKIWNASGEAEYVKLVDPAK